MQVRYGANPQDFKKYNTQEIRDEFLVEKIFSQDEINLTYSHIDRIIFGGVEPVNKKINLEDGLNVKKDLGVNFFLENRELGIINIGGKGKVIVDNKEYVLDNLNALYVGKGHKEVIFANVDKAKFFLASAPAHEAKETVLISSDKAKKIPCGDALTSNKRIIWLIIL